VKISKFVKYVSMGAVAAVMLAGCATSSTSGPSGNAKGDLRVWFMNNSVSDSGQKWLVDEFEKEHPGSTLTIEVQPWDGIVAKLQTSLASKQATPDVVEFGNTKVATFAHVGAMADISDMYDELGGKDLIQSFIDAGVVDGKKYALPLYAGVSVMYYRKDLFEKAGIAVPTTLDELVKASAAVQAANPDGTPNFKGIYLPAASVHQLESWLFTHGGNYALKDGDNWKGTLDTPEAEAAFKQLQELWSTSALGAFDSQDASNSPWAPYNNGDVAMFFSLPYSSKSLTPKMAAVTGVFPLPPVAAGGTAHEFSGGSSIGISANSQHPALARDVLKLIYSKTFMSKLASDQGWIPGNTKYSDALPAGMMSGQLQGTIAKNSILTPPAENWAIVEGNNIPFNFYSELAKGGDVDQLAKATDARIEGILNQK